MEKKEKVIRWEKLKSLGLWQGHAEAYRAKIPGGWLVLLGTGEAVFVPDPGHEWDGNSLP